MSETTSLLADQALANLVDQFARPLDFLRELAQNSIDAGTPRIEIAVDFAPDEDPSQGVLQIHVDDFGEGMDEEIIDEQLTRLFSSTKEDDLTKIGKFGIGFTSIFAIRPEAVLLRTGRHGEYWELLFHPDRSFDKIKITDPVAGTKITLYKRMRADEVERFVAEARFVLGYWCEHSDVPITWWDKTTSDDAEVPQTADPFAAFADDAASAVGPEAVNHPLALDDAVLTVRMTEGETEVVAGFCDPPRYGYYNGGLTLLASRSTDSLGTWEDALRHVSFKVKNDRLEHTLTRDNVLHDEHWQAVMEIIGRAREQLVETLVTRLEEAIRDPETNPATPQRWLARECMARPEDERTKGLLSRELFRDHAGNPVTLKQVQAQESTLGFTLLASGTDQLDDAVAHSGPRLLADTETSRELLLAAQDAPLLEVLRRSRVLMRADDAFVMPEVIDPAALTAEERQLVDRTTELLRSAVGLRLPIPATSRVVSWAPSVDSMANRITVKVGDFGGIDLGMDEVLALNGPANEGVFLRPTPEWSILPSFLRWRTLLVNRHHPLFRTTVLAVGDDPDVAALGLAQALLASEGLEPERSFRWLLEGALDGIGMEAQ